MKFLNFAKVKKAVKDFIKSIFSSNKKQITKTVISPQIDNERFKRRLGGYKRFNYKLTSKTCRKIIYKDFKLHPLPGFKMFIGKHLFEVQLNT